MPKDVTTLLNRAWWGLVLRGLVSIALGVFIFVRPLESVAAFALVIAIWALVDGFTNIVHAFDLKPLYNHWWLMLLGGIVDPAGAQLGDAQLGLADRLPRARNRRQEPPACASV